MLRILWAGASRDRALSGLAERYAERIRRRTPLRIEDLGAGRGSAPGAVARWEGERILARAQTPAHMVILDAAGSAMTSEALARWLEDRLSRSSGDLVFVVGGHEGLDAAVRSRADFALSLSSLTFTHEMARVLLLEQLYRALTILRGEPYHHGSRT